MDLKGCEFRYCAACKRFYNLVIGDSKSGENEENNNNGKQHMGECFHGSKYVHGVHLSKKLSFRFPPFEYPLLSQYPL
jgi:hypothetical protein